MTDALAAGLETVLRRQAERPALLADGQTWSYAQFDRLSGQLAAALRSVTGGEQTGGRVALLLEDRAQTTLAMLAVLRAGHGHLALDPADPSERIERLLEDGQPFALVSTQALANRLPDTLLGSCRLIDIDRPPTPSEPFAPSEISEQALAYLYYTSGSTGQPKGVPHTRANLHHQMGCYGEALAITQEDRLSALYSLGFAASLLDVHAALLHGAAVCSYDARREGLTGLADWIDQQEITILHIGASLFRKLLAQLPADRQFRSVRALVVGGDTLYASDLAAFDRHFPPGCQFFNGYSATEMGLIALYPTSTTRTDTPAVLPAGRPIADVEIAIRGTDDQPVKPGETGEIVIHSPYLTPGYWRRPELNAEVFSDDPERTGWRRYATGDQGRIDAHGQLHFSGRRGNRVKLRGYTIELAEVEGQLRALPEIADTAVSARKSADGQEVRGLTAHLVPTSGATLKPLALRRALASQLPLYMLPSAFRQHAALPLTVTGKLDRQALERDDASHDLSPAAFREPETAAERQVAGCYERLLRYAPIGRDDDFFLLGGDSLSLAQLLSELEQTFGQTLGQQQILQDASVAGVARALAQHAFVAPKNHHPLLVTVRDTGQQPALFLVHGRHGHAPISPGFLRMLDDDLSLFAFQARGLDGRQAPHRSVTEMARDYVQALREVQPQGPYLLAALCAGGYVAVEMARQLTAEGEAVAPLLLVDPLMLDPARPRQPLRQLRRTLEARLPGRYRAENERVLAQLQADGRIDFAPDDADRRQAAVRVIAALENAIEAHRPESYPGAVELLLCRDRLCAEEWGDPARRQALFPGELNWYAVGNTHEQALDVDNAELIEHFSRAVRAMRAYAVQQGAAA